MQTAKQKRVVSRAATSAKVCRARIKGRAGVESPGKKGEKKKSHPYDKKG